MPTLPGFFPTNIIPQPQRFVKYFFHIFLKKRRAFQPFPFYLFIVQSSIVLSLVHSYSSVHRFPPFRVSSQKETQSFRKFSFWLSLLGKVVKPQLSSTSRTTSHKFSWLALSKVMVSISLFSWMLMQQVVIIIIPFFWLLPCFLSVYILSQVLDFVKCFFQFFLTFLLPTSTVIVVPHGVPDFRILIGRYGHSTIGIVLPLSVCENSVLVVLLLSFNFVFSCIFYPIITHFVVLLCFILCTYYTSEYTFCQVVKITKRHTEKSLILGHFAY